MSQKQKRKNNLKKKNLLVAWAVVEILAVLCKV